MNKPKKFKALKIPEYTGGKKAFAEFITKNLQYPQEAQEAGVEGSVIVAYDILDTGAVENVRVLKGLGYGCDEEALRVIGLLRFEKVKNIKVRTRTSTKVTLHFNLNRPVISYTVTGPNTPTPPDNQSFTYTIDLNS